MLAEMTGDVFTITPKSPAVQLLDDGSPVTWTWDVTPHQTGQHRLMVTTTVTIQDGQDHDLL